MTTSLERIANAFSEAKRTQLAALMPYFTLGYPTSADSFEVITRIAADSDLLELGVPFSDPIADGPTIQRSTQKALDAGASVVGCLQMVRQLREQGVQTPAMLMGYCNPMMAYGLERYVQDAKGVGIEGFIVPDLPPEESADFASLVAAHDMAYIHFLAPTSNPRRIKSITDQAKGFIYMVSLTGVTGARSEIAAGLSEFVQNIRRQTTVPVAVGFGISTPEQAREVGQFADGVIVGSALINRYDRDGVAGSAEYIASLRAGLRR